MSAALMSAVVFAGAPSALAESDVTPQALGINGAFMEYLPPPPAPVAVCIVDTGVDVTPDTAPILQSRLTVMGDGQVGDLQLPDGHGTAVASVMGAPRNGTGSVGLWPWVRVVSVRATSSVTGGLATFNWADYHRALEVCRTTPNVKVVNFSLGGHVGGIDFQLFVDSLANTRLSSDINIVAAAGNIPGPLVLPASLDGVIPVAANDPSAAGSICPFSASAPGVLSAPGCGVATAGRSGVESLWAGTSLAAPSVATLAAALRAYRPNLTAPETEALLRASSTIAPDGISWQADASAAFRTAGLGQLVDRLGPAPSTQARPMTPVIVRRRLTPTSLLLTVADPGWGAHVRMRGIGAIRRVGTRTFSAARRRRSWPLSLWTVAQGGQLSKRLMVRIPGVARP